jgi:2-polyprenyl-6-methoxyphenol hydroxylase-like FAD-dependent oxidoreductase
MRVLIAGGGIAGPALALFLHRAGIGCTVFEAREDTATAGGGLSLAPNGTNVLDALGLADAALAAGTPALENCFRGEQGQVLARNDNGSRRYGRPAVNLRRADLHRLLAEEMRRVGCELALGASVTGVDVTHGRATLTLADGRRESGDVLIGADGIHSRVRTAVFADAPPPQYVGIVGVGGFVPVPDTGPLQRQPPTTLTFTFGRQGMVGYGGARPGELMWWCNIWREEPLSREELAELQMERLAPELARMFQAYHEPIPTIVATARETLAMNIYDMPRLPTWSRDRTVLIGDAAHAVSPNSGQGAALALEDAQELALELAAARTDPESASSRFEWRRRARVERVAREGRRRAHDKRQMSALGSRFRNAILMLTLRLSGEGGQDWLYGHRVEPRHAEGAKE